MKPPRRPENEQQRLEALRYYDLLDTPPDPALDELTELAAQICGAPISLVSLVDESRQWFKSKVGFSLDETARDISFCGHAILEPDIFVVPDTLADDRFFDNPLVTADPPIRFYAGAPLVTSDGAALGSLCVIDHVPRQLTDGQRAALQVLGRQVMAQFDLRRQYRELLDSEARLFSVFRNCPVGLAINRRTDRAFVDVNETFLRLYGCSREDVIGRTASDLQIADPAATAVLRSQLTATGSVRDVELEVRTRDGRARRVLVSAEQVELRTGPHTITSFIDITARKDAELATSRLAAIVESSTDAIIGKDLKGIVTSWNGGAEKLFGYTAAEMIGTSVARLIPEERSGEEEWILGRVTAGERIDGFETRRRTKDGRLLEVSITASPIKDSTGAIIGASKVARDITERKRIEARYRRLVNSNAQGVMFFDAEGNITEANDAFLHIVGYTRTDLERGRVNWNVVTPPEYAQLDAHGFQELAEHGVCTPFEKEYLRKDGTRVPVFVGAAAFEDRPDEGVCFVLDLTERKRLEQQLLRSQRMESVGTLAGGIAHDLNNVLTPILMSVGMLKECVTSEDARGVVETVEASAKRAASLVSQVLAFARGVDGQRVPINLRHVLDELLKVMRETFPKSIDVRFSPGNDLWTVTGDATQLHQVFLNLCVNARDAMPDGGALALTVSNVVLDDTYASMNLDARPGPYVMVKVDDNGTGIPRHVRDRIFEPFFTTKGVGQGTGLGLSTTLAIVQSHGGFIHVYSEPGSGTKIKVYLPANATAVDANVVAVDQSAIPRGNGELILLVDDEPTILNTAQRTLEHYGYTVVVARHGAEAVSQYVRYQSAIALVLTDMAMPIMDGPALIVALKLIDPKVRVIGSSGLTSTGGVAKAIGGGMPYFVPKPYSAESLLTTIHRVLTEPDGGSPQ